MDAEGRRPDHEDYDPSSLFIPESEWNSFTPGMVRYWQIKTKNFDKIVLYRFGHWFIVYYQDAFICNRMVDLCIPPRQMQKITGFHESHLQDNIEIIVDAGYKVAICEQTENGKQKEERIKKEKEGKSVEEKKKIVDAIQREVT